MFRWTQACEYKMANTDYSLLILCIFGFCCVSGDLNLSAGAACVSNGVNGTCVDIFECNSAAVMYLYNEAGISINCECPSDTYDVCSSEGKRPVVCCTDCYRGSWLKNSAIGAFGTIVSTAGSVAKSKCYDYFKRLPYPCHGKGNVKLRMTFDEEKQCHKYDLGIALAVGGRDAKRWEFPHMALLGFGADVRSAQWLCGGSVISEKYVLTAAHCTSTRSLGELKLAALGLLRRTDPLDTWKVYNISRIIIHPEYKSPSKYHDIALLEMETESDSDVSRVSDYIKSPAIDTKVVPSKTKPTKKTVKRKASTFVESESRITFGKDLLPACLDVGSHDKFTANAPGWGRLGHKQGLADNLQVVTLSEFNETECSELYQPHRHLKTGYDHKTQMCYGSHSAIVDTCEGDSGGPLQTDQFQCLYTVVGLTSFGKSCGVLGKAGVYTRVSYYVPWIESVAWPGETNEIE